MKVGEQNINEGQIVKVVTKHNKTFAGFCYEPKLLSKIFKIPFTEGTVIGITEINLKDYDMSLNPLKILSTLEAMTMKIAGIPMYFKASEIEHVFVLDTVAFDGEDTIPDEPLDIYDDTEDFGEQP